MRRGIFVSGQQLPSIRCGQDEEGLGKGWRGVLRHLAECENAEEIPARKMTTEGRWHRGAAFLVQRK